MQAMHMLLSVGRFCFSSQSLQLKRRVPWNKTIFFFEGRGSDEQTWFI